MTYLKTGCINVCVVTQYFKGSQHNLGLKVNEKAKERSGHKQRLGWENCFSTPLEKFQSNDKFSFHAHLVLAEQDDFFHLRPTFWHNSKQQLFFCQSSYNSKKYIIESKQSKLGTTSKNTEMEQFLQGRGNKEHKKKNLKQKGKTKNEVK